MKQNQWSEVRNQGRLRYILSHWVFGAAIPAVILLLIIRFVKAGFNFDTFTLGSIVLSIVFCILAATIYGVWKWRKNERSYTNRNKSV